MNKFDRFEKFRHDDKKCVHRGGKFLYATMTLGFGSTM